MAIYDTIVFMRYLGIDYGKKRVGVAISDETGQFALPLSVLAGGSSLLEELKKIILEKKVGTIILGESKNFKGEDNAILSEIREFKQKFESEVGLPVFLEPEFMTSAEAERMGEQEPNQSRRSGLHLRSPKEKNKMLDASAAALILKSYLDKQPKK